MNLLAAAWKLANYQLWNRKRRWVTVGLFLFSVVFVAVIGLIPGGPSDAAERADFYQGFITMALGTVLIPFVAIFWGSAVLADEVEGKTLVYLWTRPRHRGFLLLIKFLMVFVWMCLVALVGIAATYLYAYSLPESGGLASNAPIMLWDWRALILCGLAYGSLGFLFSFIFRKPLTFGLMIAYGWEFFASFAPGFIRRISIRQQVLALSTHKPPEEQGITRRFIQPVVITETEALLTLAGVILVCLVIATYLASQREFLSDDPARNQ